MSRPPAWRPMVPADIDRVVDIAAVCYPDHFEERAVYKNRLTVFPAGCLMLAGEGEGEAEGYVLSHPWTMDAVPALNAVIDALPAAPDAYYLHDLAIMPAARGEGHSRSALDALRAGSAAMAPAITLVSVNGTVPFWERHGFAVRRTPELDAKLESYGADARFMVRPG